MQWKFFKFPFLCHGPHNCHYWTKPCFQNLFVSHNSCLFDLDISSYLLFNFNDYPSGMITLFNLLVLGNWHLWMEVKILLFLKINLCGQDCLPNSFDNFENTSVKVLNNFFVFANLCFFILLSLPSQFLEYLCAKVLNKSFVFANLCFFILLSHTSRAIGNWLEVLGA